MKNDSGTAEQLHLQKGVASGLRPDESGCWDRDNPGGGVVEEAQAVVPLPPWTAQWPLLPSDRLDLRSTSSSS